MKNVKFHYSLSPYPCHGAGASSSAAHMVMQTPLAALQARIAAGTPAPPVLTPATPPPALTQATQTVLHPV